jgi:hypothetical protein
VFAVDDHDATAAAMAAQYRFQSRMRESFTALSEADVDARTDVFE